MEIVLLDVYPIEQNSSIINIIKSHQQTHKCTFTTSRFSDKSNSLIWIDSNSESFENPIFLSRGISKPDVLEFYFALNFFRNGDSDLRGVFVHLDCVDQRWLIDNLKNSIRSCMSLSEIWHLRTCICGLLCSKHNAENSSEYIFSTDFFLSFFWLHFNKHSGSEEHTCKDSILAKLRHSKCKSCFNMSGHG